MEAKLPIKGWTIQFAVIQHVYGDCITFLQDTWLVTKRRKGFGAGFTICLHDHTIVSLFPIVLFVWKRHHYSGLFCTLQKPVWHTGTITAWKQRQHHDCQANDANFFETFVHIFMFFWVFLTKSIKIYLKKSISVCEILFVLLNISHNLSQK